MMIMVLMVLLVLLIKIIITKQEPYFTLVCLIFSMLVGLANRLLRMKWAVSFSLKPDTENIIPLVPYFPVDFYFFSMTLTFLALTYVLWPSSDITLPSSVLPSKHSGLLSVRYLWTFPTQGHCTCSSRYLGCASPKYQSITPFLLNLSYMKALPLFSSKLHPQNLEEYMVHSHSSINIVKLMWNELMNCSYRWADWNF